MPAPVTGTFSVDPATVQPVTVHGQGVAADGLAINKAGELFAYVNTDANNPPVGNGTAQLIRIEPSDGTAVEIGAPLPNVRIAGAAFDMDDNLWVLDWINKQLIKIKPDGSVDGATAAITIVGINAPYTVQGAFADIAFDIDGNCYLSTNQDLSSASTAVYSVDMKTGAVSPISPNLSGSLSSTGKIPSPVGMAFTATRKSGLVRAKALTASSTVQVSTRWIPRKLPCQISSTWVPTTAI
ncbi:MAG: hypothetical protein LBP52_06325 [Burkholderiaceae bacterium]|jgi:sugar lactone lactonase YvrE|nr:hypothetical protein [Burkholderiaceae bacterium]